MQGKKTATIALICFLAMGIGYAQQMVTLEDAIAAALKNNYDIRLLQNDSVAASINKNYIYSGFLPSINGTIGRTQTTSAQKQQYKDRPEVQGSGIRTTNLNAAVNLNWVLFDGLGMFATRDKINELFELGRINVKNQVINSVANVISGYYIIVRQKQKLKAIEEQMSINEERVKLADRKLSVGLGTRPELLQAKVDLNAQKAAHLEQQSIMSQSKEALNQLTGMQLPENFEVSDSIPIHAGLTLSEIQNQIEATSPSILQAIKNVDLSKISLNETKAKRWPTISFGSNYNFARTDIANNISPFAPVYNRNKGFNFGFSAQIPLLNYMNVNRNIRQAKLDIAYQQIILEKQKTTINVMVKAGYYNYSFQLSALRLEEENIELAKENVFIALERFKQGVSTYLELREAQKSLEDAYDRLIAARYNTKLAETELLRLKGELIR
ncbi:MAG: TolC family protein [Bacteroidetes bacterium]|nr:TolC family protein [Bacteroidota bacterium]